jgi:hypothetical protein
MLGHIEFGNLVRPEVFVFLFSLFLLRNQLMCAETIFQTDFKTGNNQKLANKVKKLLQIEIEAKKIKFFSQLLGNFCITF